MPTRRRALASEAAFLLHETRLVIRDSGAHLKMQASIAACIAQLHHNPAPTLQGGCHIPLPRQAGRKAPVHLPCAVPDAAPQEWVPQPPGMVMLTLVDPEEQLRMDARLLRDALNLTAAESRIAASL